MPSHLAHLSAPRSIHRVRITSPLLRMVRAFSVEPLLVWDEPDTRMDAYYSSHLFHVRVMYFTALCEDVVIAPPTSHFHFSSYNPWPPYCATNPLFYCVTTTGRNKEWAVHPCFIIGLGWRESVNCFRASLLVFSLHFTTSCVWRFHFSKNTHA